MWLRYSIQKLIINVNTDHISTNRIFSKGIVKTAGQSRATKHIIVKLNNYKKGDEYHHKIIVEKANYTNDVSMDFFSH